jgi:6-phosphogluconate dehydrogenase
MVGGDGGVIEVIEPLLQALAPGVETAVRTPGKTGDPSPAEQGYLRCGPSGSGHFAKMIHNGIEYGMMASLAEGLNILGTASKGDAPYNRFDFDLPALTELWRRGFVLAS